MIDWAERCINSKRNYSYKVVSVDTAGYGEDYAKDIKRFIKGYASCRRRTNR
ncbi:MAG: hypothetical protein MR384_08655 [Lachnospiraceae bacterium]|nr:hypothetical protein [Lachnospiraceae bacterium]